MRASIRWMVLAAISVALLMVGPIGWAQIANNCNPPIQQGNCWTPWGPGVPCQNTMCTSWQMAFGGAASPPCPNGGGDGNFFTCTPYGNAWQICGNKAGVNGQCTLAIVNCGYYVFYTAQPCNLLTNCGGANGGFCYGTAAANCAPGP